MISRKFYPFLIILSGIPLFSDEAKQRALVDYISVNTGYIRVFDLFPTQGAWNYGAWPPQIEIRLFELPESKERREEILERYFERNVSKGRTATGLYSGDPFSANNRSLPESNLDDQDARVLVGFQRMVQALKSYELGYLDPLILDALPLGNQRFPLEFLNYEREPFARAYSVSSTGVIFFTKVGELKDDSRFDDFIVRIKTVTDSILDITGAANQLLLPLWDVDSVVGKNSIILENNLIQVYGIIETLENNRPALFGRNSYLPILDSSIDIPNGPAHLVGRLRFSFQPKSWAENNENIYEKFFWFQPLRIIGFGESTPLKSDSPQKLSKTRTPEQDGTGQPDNHPEKNPKNQLD